ncbi:hypothetical protein ACIA8K_14175 [Catenuloplanes sp. NPDC051500]|uniref:hypothetical protein n=1 Tax=Catenuloplanes sp. NPDC051500 TaxID=3363959 RepID=UPI003795D702
MTTEQPHGSPSAVPANPYQQLTNAYYSPGSAPGAPSPVMWTPPPTRSPAGPIAVGLVAIVLLGFGLTFGANEFAKREVCGGFAAAQAPAAGTPAVQANTTGKGVPATTTAAESPTAAQMRDEVATMKRYATMLVLDGDLRVAVKDLTVDVDSMLRLGEEFKGLTDEERMDNAPRVVALATDMTAHVNAVQRACGLAETAA